MLEVDSPLRTGQGAAPRSLPLVSQVFFFFKSQHNSADKETLSKTPLGGLSSSPSQET